MKVTRIEIVDYKSISKTGIDPEDFNVVIGQNNHGKTNFLDAIAWFFSGADSLGDIAQKRTVRRFSASRRFLSF